MSGTDSFRLYGGNGSRAGESRSLELPVLPPLDDPSAYIAEPALQDAVNVALALGQPLLVTGEPGTGKTQLGASIAYDLGLPSPLTFNTKTTSSARDLFYQYDALGHFHDAQFSEGRPSIDRYIEFNALGLAILLAMDGAEVDDMLPERFRGTGPRRSVVVIDEIDKAPRDLPNDVLNEIEQMSFTVKETGRSFAADRRFKPIVVLTSNSEKTLPEAFLRRCIFFHLPFPGRDRLTEIVERRLGNELKMSPERIQSAVTHFEDIRKLGLRKKPATAELLAWLRVVDRLDLDLDNIEPGERETVVLTYSVLAKSKDDLVLLNQRQV